MFLLAGLLWIPHCPESQGEGYTYGHRQHREDTSRQTGPIKDKLQMWTCLTALASELLTSDDWLGGQMSKWYSQPIYASGFQYAEHALCLFVHSHNKNWGCASLCWATAQSCSCVLSLTLCLLTSSRHCIKELITSQKKRHFLAVQFKVVHLHVCIHTTIKQVFNSLKISTGKEMRFVWQNNEVKVLIQVCFSEVNIVYRSGPMLIFNCSSFLEC